MPHPLQVHWQYFLLLTSHSHIKLLWISVGWCTASLRQWGGDRPRGNVGYKQSGRSAHCLWSVAGLWAVLHNWSLLLGLGLLPPHRLLCAWLNTQQTSIIIQFRSDSNVRSILRIYKNQTCDILETGHWNGDSGICIWKGTHTKSHSGSPILHTSQVEGGIEMSL